MSGWEGGRGRGGLLGFGPLPLKSKEKKKERMVGPLDGRVPMASSKPSSLGLYLGFCLRERAAPAQLDPKGFNSGAFALINPQLACNRSKHHMTLYHILFQISSKLRACCCLALRHSSERLSKHEIPLCLLFYVCFCRACLMSRMP